MTTIFFDARMDDEQRRRLIFEGHIFVYSPRPSTVAFCQFARERLERAFAPLQPTQAQFQLRLDELSRTFSGLRHAFTQDVGSLECIRTILRDFGCDVEATYLDVPRLRAMTSDGFLTPWGKKFLLHPHRDTWYAAPGCEVNWWMPIYDIASDNCLAFHPNYWQRPVHNGSCAYDHAEWMDEERFKVIDREIKAGLRRHPFLKESLDLDPQLRVVCQAGGILMFSAAHLHSSVPNTSGSTRYSFDFRTAHLGDAVTSLGAPNIDAEARGTALSGFVRGVDFAPFPSEVAARYADGTPLLGTRPIEAERSAAG